MDNIRKQLYVTKAVATKIHTIDDDFHLKYISFSTMNQDLFNKPPGGQFGFIWGDSFIDCALKEEVYKWCIENGFRYKKVAFSGDMAYIHDSSTGILFKREEDALAFTLRWS